MGCGISGCKGRPGCRLLALCARAASRRQQRGRWRQQGPPRPRRAPHQHCFGDDDEGGARRQQGQVVQQKGGAQHQAGGGDEQGQEELGEGFCERQSEEGKAQARDLSPPVEDAPPAPQQGAQSRGLLARGQWCSAGSTGPRRTAVAAAAHTSSLPSQRRPAHECVAVPPARRAPRWCSTVSCCSVAESMTPATKAPSSADTPCRAVPSAHSRQNAMAVSWNESAP